MLNKYFEQVVRPLLICFAFAWGSQSPQPKDFTYSKDIHIVRMQ